MLALPSEVHRRKGVDRRNNNKIHERRNLVGGNNR